MELKKRMYTTGVHAMLAPYRMALFHAKGTKIKTTLTVPKMVVLVVLGMLSLLKMISNARLGTRESVQISMHLQRWFKLVVSPVK